MGYNNKSLSTFYINFHHNWHGGSPLLHRKWDGGSPLLHPLPWTWAGRVATLQNIAHRCSRGDWPLEPTVSSDLNSFHSHFTSKSCMTISNVKGAGVCNLQAPGKKPEISVGEY